MKTKIAAMALILFLVQACKKENQPPVISIEQPLANAIIVSGDSLHFEGTASDENALHEGLLQIVRASDDSLISQISLTVHGIQSYPFSKDFRISVKAPIDVKAKATFTDHDSGVTTKEVAVQLKP